MSLLLCSRAWRLLQGGLLVADVLCSEAAMLGGMINRSVCSYTNKQIPWSTVYFKKLRGPQLQEIICILLKQTVHFSIRKSLPLAPLMSQMTPAHVCLFIFFRSILMPMVLFIVISFKFTHLNECAFLFFPHTCYTSHFIFVFIALIIFLEE